MLHKVCSPAGLFVEEETSTSLYVAHVELEVELEQKAGAYCPPIMHLHPDSPF